MTTIDQWVKQVEYYLAPKEIKPVLKITEVLMRLLEPGDKLKLEIQNA